MAIINITNLNLSFGEKTIFKDFNLKINEKEKVRIFAPSGRGKTTLFRILCGFVVPASGNITIDGIVRSSKNIKDIRKKISLCAEFDFLDLNISEMLKMIFSFEANTHLAFEEEKYFYLAEKLYLEKEIFFKKLSALSAGEKQRISLITGILLDRKIFLFDEVTANLDEKSKNSAIDLICSLNKTCLIISHDEKILRAVDREVIL